MHFKCGKNVAMLLGATVRCNDQCWVLHSQKRINYIFKKAFRLLYVLLSYYFNLNINLNASSRCKKHIK